MEILPPEDADLARGIAYDIDRGPQIRLRPLAALQSDVLVHAATLCRPCLSC